MKLTTVTPKFVEFIPDKLSDGVLYISERYHTASHKCCCGCGEEVVTPLTPADWSLRKDGDVVTLHPSIGNWSFACRSHYWVRRNKVVWDGAISRRQVQRVRARDLADKEAYVASVNRNKGQPRKPVSAFPKPVGTASTSVLHQLWTSFIKWLNH
ncbi:MAG: hypothetical protein K8H75_11700 [Sulfuricella sp.]|nr:hypothetical protein [Sulfuricella sp.]